MHVHGLGKRRRAAEDMEAIYAALLQNQEAISDLEDLLYPISDDDDEGDDDDEEGRAAALLGELEDLEEEQELMLAVLNELGANFERLSQSLGVQRQHFGLNSAFFRDLSPASVRKDFRFDAGEIRALVQAFGLEGRDVLTPDRARFAGDEALLVVLTRLAYPTRWTSLSVKLGAQPGHLSALCRATCAYLDDHFAIPLSNLFAKLDAQRVTAYCAAVRIKSGTNNDQCSGFLDGEFIKHCRPNKDQVRTPSMHRAPTATTRTLARAGREAHYCDDR